MTKQEIMKEILREIDTLPPIPENIIKIRNLLQDTKSTFKEISFYIKQDPSLSADLLKTANSAWYSLRTKVDNIERAISIIGLRQLSAILLTLGAKTVMTERFVYAEEVWKHSYKSAFYAQNIIKIKTRDPDRMESAYSAGLLHDIGKLVLLTISPQLVERITDLSEQKNISPTVIEKLSIGLSHAEIGEKIAIKWNFPPCLSAAIAFHHDPKLINNDCADVTYSVYLANLICDLDSVNASLILEIDQKVLEFFGISTEEDLDKIIKSISTLYNHASFQ